MFQHELAARALTDILFEESGIGRCLVAPDGSVLRANPEWLRSTGFSLDDVLGADIIGLFPETRDMALAMHARARAGHSVEVPRHAQRCQGRERWWEGRIDPVPMEGGNGVLITVREVAVERREVVPHEAEQRFRVLTEAMPQIVCVLGPDGVPEYVNPTWVAFSGLDLEATRRAGFDGVVHPDDLESARECRRGVLRSLEPRDAELRFRAADGTHRWFLSRLAPVVDEGRVVRLVGAAMDIDDRKRAEEALRRERDFTTAVIDTAGALVIVMDREGRILRFNRACESLTGHSAAEATGHTIWDLGLIAPEEVPAVRGTWEALVRGERPHSGETCWITRDGARRLIEWSTTAIPGSDGRAAYVVGTGVDVTERKRAEAAVREADQHKTEYLAVLSHELRSPLAPIRNSIYLLEHADPGSEQATRARGVIRRQTEHLTSLVEDLLDVTRISRGKIALQRARLDLREIVRRATDDLHSIFVQGGIELRLDFVTFGPVWVDADATRIAQVVGNLLQNAAKFTASGGAVTVTVAATDGQAEIAVRDTGVGMEPGTVERMFEPFAQGAQTLARTAGGLGLGLALVKGLVELHGGTIAARSDGIGRGAEFLVRLPRAGPPPERRSAGAPSPGARPRSVLVVEDNPDAGQSLADVLELNGHRVRIARDAASGLALARELRPEVVLCDIGLPDMDGHAVAQALRRDEALRATRLIALSGHAQPEDRQRSRDAGFDAHVAKPVDVDELMTVMAHDHPGPRGAT